MAASLASTSVSASSVVTSARQAKPAGKQLGTLVVVVIKARNLPNKQRIGKQDPYCSITLGHQKQKTPAVKRGGQTPHWDAQLQFEIWEESDDKIPIRSTETGGIGPSSAISSKKDEDLLPGQATVGRVKPKANTADASKRLMKIACYADDPREPELIGETELDYAPTLKKGEFDEWVEIKHKGKYAGEVFIEMTFYSAAPPPVKRKSKPAIPGSGYGGPGHFESLPDSYPQSPPSSIQPRPSSHLSPVAAQPCMSQSQYSLNTSTSNRPPSTSASLDEFGRRRPTPTPLAFPTPSGDGSTSSYNPPYAPPSLAPSASSHDLARPHRASFSSYGMTQHDIDSMIRPLSSLSIGGSVNKPLPLPQPDASQPHRPTAILARPQSGQDYAMATQPTPSPRPYADIHAITMQPGLHHHHSQPDAYQSSAQPYTAAQHPPTHHHRHSMTTYLPDGGDVPWDGNQISVPVRQQRPSQEIGLHHPPADDSHTTFSRPNSSWQDPRATSSYPQSPACGIASPTQSASYHPSVLQPGTSPRVTHVSPPLPSHSPLPTEPPVWNSASHYASPVLGEPLQYPTGQGGHFDSYADSQPYQHQPSAHQPAQGYGQGTYSGDAHAAPYHASQAPQVAEQYQPQPIEPQGYAYDQGAQQPQYNNHEQYHHQQQQYDQGYSQSSYDHSQPTESGGYQHQVAQPPPAGHYQQQHQHGQHRGQLQQDYRINSPYRPLPQPTPDPPPLPQQYASQEQPYYPAQSGYEQQQPQAPPPRQPRFGLPVHQPYDPPYIPPSSRQSQHYVAPNQQQTHQVPPPVPPVPQELKQDLYGSHGYSSNHY